MIYRTAQDWILWGGCHPTAIGCTAEGREQCACKYHIVNKAESEIYSFDEFQEADEKFMELTNEKSFKDLIINRI